MHESLIYIALSAAVILGETVLAHMWTGDAILAGLPDSGGREGIVYVIPQEGCNIWQDNMAAGTQ